MSRVFIGVGHGGKDPGSIANGLVEKNINLVMALAMRDELVRNGVSVGISRTSDVDDTLDNEIKKCNAFKPDVAVSVHNNSAGGDGFEAFIQTNGYAAKSRQFAASIEAEVKKIGQNSRGLKTRKNSANTADFFGWLRNVRCPAVLCEGAFLDSADRFIIDTIEEQREFGKAYARGVMAILGIQVKEVMKPMVNNNEPSAWAKEAWEKATRAGITDGTRPKDTATREEIIVMLARAGVI